jgi:hypothetical protein
MNFHKFDPRKTTREEALLLPDDDKRLYFKLVRLMHPRISEKLGDMLTLAMPDSGTSIVLLVGPTGVGKSTLVSSLAHRIIDSMRDEIESDPGFVPVVVMDAPASGERGFSWRMFYLRLGDALNEPLMDKKLEARVDGPKSIVHLPGLGSTVTGMRVSVERVLAHRRTILVVVDEAVHLMRKAKGNTLDNHMDALKSLADTGATLVLIGAYDLLEFTTLSAQVARRTAIVHFNRYVTGIEEDERAFRTAIKQFQERMPLRKMPDLTERASELQIACLGCIGILKSTLAKTLAGVLQGGGKWSDSHLQKALFTQAQFNTILSETLAGEAAIREMEIGTGSFKSLTAKAKEIEFQARETA